MSNVADWARGAVRWETGLAIVVLLILIVGSAVSPDFLTGNNLFNLGLSNGEIAIMTLPMTLIIISGEIDLSVASILGLASALLGVLWSKGWPMPAVFVVVALTGLAAGAVNGLLVTRLRLPSLAVTIGTLALYRGIATILLGPNTVSSFPTAYTNLGINAVPFTGNDITYSTAIFLVLALIFGVVLHATPAGRSIYAMGASAEAAQFAGIRVKRVKTILFMVSGLICALAGVLYTFRLDTAVQNNGLGLELSVVAIVLLAGHFILKIPFDDLVGVASGATGNPAILVYSTRMAPTERPDIGYAMIFPSMTIVKVIAVQVVGLLSGVGG